MITTEYSDRAVRTIAAAVIALVLLGFAAVQFASDALYAQAAATGSLPSRLPAAFGLRVYDALDRIAPAAYVESTLARAALQRGDPDLAEHYAVRLPPTPVRDGLLEQIAAARGQRVLAYEYAFAAPDITAVQDAVAQLRARDPQRAYALERQFIARLQSLQTHPDAVAHGWWMLGTIASQVRTDAWQQRAYDDYVEAARLAPLDLTNVLGAANEAVTRKDWRSADAWYRRALQAHPADADATAGLGIVALNARRDRLAAQRDLARALAADPHSALAEELARELSAKQ